MRTTTCRMQDKMTWANLGIFPSSQLQYGVCVIHGDWPLTEFDCAQGNIVVDNMTVGVNIKRILVP